MMIMAEMDERHQISLNPRVYKNQEQTSHHWKTQINQLIVSDNGKERDNQAFILFFLNERSLRVTAELMEGIIHL